jgi:hypothetical protein
MLLLLSPREIRFILTNGFITYKISRHFFSYLISNDVIPFSITGRLGQSCDSIIQRLTLIVDPENLNMKWAAEILFGRSV